MTLEKNQVPIIVFMDLLGSSQEWVAEGEIKQGPFPLQSHKELKQKARNKREHVSPIVHLSLTWCG